MFTPVEVLFVFSNTSPKRARAINMTAHDLTCLIIADDFTGACDSGLQFVRAGFSARVFSGPPEKLEAPTMDVIVCNTESRNSDTDRARQLVTSACQPLRALQPSVLYKKVDSTIRGNLGSEIETVMESFAINTGIVAPAFPEAGRTTVHGRHFLNGVPVDETELAADPGAPVNDSNLPHVLATPAAGGTDRLEVRHIDIDDVSRGTSHLLSRLAVRGSERTLFVCDAARPEDLRSVAEAAAGMESTPLLCGSAGLAQFLPEAFSLRPAGPLGIPVPTRPGPVLVIVGSLQSHSRRQTDRLLSNTEAREFRCDTSTLEQALEHLNSTQDAVCILSMMEIPDLEGALRELISVARNLIQNAPQLAGVAVTGGTTAMALITALGASGVEIVEPISREVPMCRLMDGPFDGLKLVTKAGALGDEDIFIKAVECLTNTRRGGGGDGR